MFDTKSFFQDFISKYQDKDIDTQISIFIKLRDDLIKKGKIKENDLFSIQTYLLMKQHQEALKILEDK